MKSSSRVVYSSMWDSLSQISYVVAIVATAAHLVSKEPNSLVSFLSVGAAFLTGEVFRKWSHDEFFSYIRERQPLSPLCDAGSRIAFFLSGLVLISAVLRPLDTQFMDIATYTILVVVGLGLQKLAISPSFTRQSRSLASLDRMGA